MVALVEVNQALNLRNPNNSDDSLLNALDVHVMSRKLLDNDRLDMGSVCHVCEHDDDGRRVRLRFGIVFHTNSIGI